MFEGVNKRDALIGVGVAVGAAALILVVKRNGASGGGGTSAATGGTSDIMGGFTSASTVFVPTSSYDITYNTYKGTVTNQTSNSNGNTSTISTTGGNSPVVGSHPIIGDPGIIKPPVIPAPAPIPKPPTIVTTVPPKPIPVKPPIVAPKPAPAPVPKPAPKPAPKPVASHPKPVSHPVNPIIGAVQHSGAYATPKGGWNSGSIVDTLKANGDNSSMAARQKLASAAGIKGYTGTASQNTALLKDLNSAGLHIPGKK